MILYHIFLLAVIQGLTEFLPISSSGHLVLTHAILDSEDVQGAWDNNVLLDIAVHVGTLFSVLLYFWRDAVKMLLSFKDIATGNVKAEGSKLTLFVLAGSIPVIIAGFILHALEPDWIRALYVMATTTIVFGVVLWWADSKSPAKRTLENMRYRDVLWIGGAQVLALVPGTSRSGITMTAARFLGFSRVESARYSLLLAIIAISGAGFLSSISLLREGDLALTLDALVAVLFSFISGWLSIAVMMKFIEKSSFTVFAVYRVILGTALLVLLYSGVIG
jgi:undecaprenyl-diphosphatase